MNDEHDIANNIRGWWERELKAIPGVRWWKIDAAKWEALIDLGLAQVEALGRFVPGEFKKIVQQAVDAIANFKQPTLEEALAIPTGWINPITGQPLGLPKNVDEAAALQKKDPRLLKLLEDFEKAPYQTAVRLQEEAARHARLAAIRYGASDEPSNAYYGTDLEAQAALVREDPDRAEVFKWEAASPIRIPWQDAKHDPDGMGRLQRHAPDVFKLAHRAAELMRARAKAAAAEAAAEIQAAQKKLLEAKKLAAS